MITPDEIFAMLSVKDGMTNSRYFVGRKELLSNLSGCAFGDQRSSAWIYGPRRIGKSSVARALERKAILNGGIVLWIDCIDLGNIGIEGVIQRIIEKATAFTTLQLEKGSRFCFEQLSYYSKARPITIIFDEFDKIAMSLKDDDQAFLRRLVTENDRLCYIFISCLPPISIVEEIPEIHSRILGICNQQRIIPLERRDIKELCDLVANDLSQPELSKFYDKIRANTGGFPVAVTTLVKRFAVRLQYRGKIDDDDINDILQEAYEELEVDIRSFWSTLKPGTRLVLLGKANSTQFENDLKEDGFYNRGEGLVSPSFFLKSAETIPTCSLYPQTSSNIPADEMNAVICAFKLVAEINEHLKLNGFPDGFYIGSRSVEFYRVCGNPCTKEHFENAIQYLYRVFFEGARTDNKDKAYRLPPPLDEIYKKNEIIGHISDLRNYLAHDKSRSDDTNKPNRHFKRAGEIFLIHCGHRDPNTDDLRNKVRNSLIKHVIILLENIFGKLTEIESN